MAATVLGYTKTGSIMSGEGYSIEWYMRLYYLCIVPIGLYFGECSIQSVYWEQSLVLGKGLGHGITQNLGRVVYHS